MARSAELGLLSQIMAELRAIHSILAQDTGLEPEPACPRCGGTDLEDTSCSGEPNRSTCRRCGRSFGQEAANG